MAISEKLLEILVDPLTKQPVKLVKKDDRERLYCESSGLYYRVEGDIPVMLIDEAELEDGSPATEKVKELREKMTTSEK